MIQRTLLAGAFLSCALLLVPGVSSAQSASDKAAAEALFDEGVSLLKQGKFQEASQRLESSQRIDPGIGTLLYLAEAYEKLGRTASAWATFREAASQAKAGGQMDRAAIGAQRADRLTPKLDKLTIQLAPENKDIQSITLLENGTNVAPALWGTPIPMDPGEHKLEVRAPGYVTFTSSVTVSGEGQTQSFTIPALEKAPEAAPAPAPAATPAPALATTQVSVPGADHSDRGSLQRTAGLGLAGLGVVGVGVGTFFGIRAINKDSDAGAYCNGTTCGDKRGEELSNEAIKSANIANIAFIAGGVCAVGGLVLYLTAPHESEPAKTAVVHMPRIERIGVRPAVAGGGAFEVGGSF